MIRNRSNILYYMDMDGLVQVYVEVSTCTEAPSLLLATGAATVAIHSINSDLTFALQAADNSSRFACLAFLDCSCSTS